MTTTSVKTFTLAQMASLVTSRLCCQLGDYYEALNHITGDRLYTHVLPRAARFAKPILEAKFPELGVCELNLHSLDKWLESSRKNRCPEEGVKMWLAELKMMFPELDREFEVESYSDAWLSMDPAQELRNMAGDKVVVVGA